MSSPVEDRLSATEKRIEKLEKRPKDFWDVFQIVASLLVPVSISLAGYFFSDAQKQAERVNGEAAAAQQRETSRIQVRVGQAQLISTFMESLTSPNAERRALAIEAVLVALPEDGPRLLKVISRDKSNAGSVRAETVLDLRRSRLIADCFDPDKTTRISATTEIIQGWLKDDKLVPELIGAAQTRTASASGVINALVILENVDLATLAIYADLVTKFADSVKSTGPETASHAERLKARVQRAPPAR